MITLDELCASLGARQSEVRGWIQAGFVEAIGESQSWHFAEVDAARVRLIFELRYQMNVVEEDLDLVLRLLDQVYGLRRELQALAQAVSRQPDAVRSAIAAAMKEGGG
jgi:chaperone modulatory protein CbpM